jgi:hypothetical protein
MSNPTLISNQKSNNPNQTINQIIPNHQIIKQSNQQSIKELINQTIKQSNNQTIN